MNATIVTKPGGYQVVSIEGAYIVGNPNSVWRKFTGIPTDSGMTHKFTIYIDEQFVKPLQDYGLEVRWREPKDNWEGFWYLTITLSWRFGDPKVYTVAYNGVRSLETEATIGELDHNDKIQFIDMEVSKGHYKSHGREGVTAYGKDVHIYLGAPSISEQRYMERFPNMVAAAPVQAEIPMEDDIPWDDDTPGV